MFRSNKRAVTTKETVPRIAGGQNAPHGSVPWQVSVRIKYRDGRMTLKRTEKGFV
jgi:hypothetical protein